MTLITTGYYTSKQINSSTNMFTYMLVIKYPITVFLSCKRNKLLTSPTIFQLVYRNVKMLNKQAKWNNKKQLIKDLVCVNTLLKDCSSQSVFLKSHHILGNNLLFEQWSLCTAFLYFCKVSFLKVQKKLRQQC